MKKITLIVILAILCFSCLKVKPKSIKKDTNKIAVTAEIADGPIEKIEYEPYTFDTLLKDGFHLSYRAYNDSVTNEPLQKLTLVKGNKDITILNETSRPMLHKNLGYIGADFTKSFVFVQSYGSGNPSEFQLIEKKTGREIKSGVYVDSNEDNEILVYISNLHKIDEQLKIYDIANKKEINVNDFKNSKCYKEYPEGLRSCVTIDTVTNSKITLTIEDEKIVKHYKR